jgi:DNA-binding MarR family transcriptional regulator
MKLPRTSYFIRQIQLRIYANLAEQLKEFELTPAQYMVLSLSSGQAERSSADLARRAQMTPQSMNELTAPLFRKGFVKRRPHPEDSRVLLLSLTKAGQRLLARCDKLMDQVEEDIFGCLDRQHLTSLRSALSMVLSETYRAEGESVGQQRLAGQPGGTTPRKYRAATWAA